jgi:hypothetical protein
MTKKTIIDELREFGIKATYQNICWCRNKDFEIVGGILYARNNQDIHFKVENKIVSLVKDYNEIRPLIFA